MSKYEPLYTSFIMNTILLIVPLKTSSPLLQTFWEDSGDVVIGALVGLIIGMLTWVLKPTFEKLGATILQGLSKLGSGMGFRRIYTNHLIEEHRGFNVRGLKTRAPVTIELEQVYVQLRAQLPRTSNNADEFQAMDLNRAMKQHERLVILGGPGTGKSTLLAFLTLTYAQKKAVEHLGLNEQRLPILVLLRQLKEVLKNEDNIRTLPAYLDKWYVGLGMPSSQALFETMLQKGRCVVMLDGLDEVADETERRQLSEWVDQLVTIYPRNRYIVTSRPTGYDEVPLENGFTEMYVCDFGIEDIRHFASNWCLAVEMVAQGEDNPTVRRRARDAAQDLISTIQTHPAIQKLAVNPLLLSIIALVHRYRATLPKRRVDLYAECVDVLLGHWDEAKGLVGSLSPGGKRAILQPLALRMHLDNNRDISRRQLESLIAGLLPAVGGKTTDAPDFISEVRERSGLLMETGLNTYAFSHLTFQEYLCARELVDNEHARFILVTKASENWWREVLLLYVGMAEATSVITALLESSNNGDESHLLLAGRCVAEAMRVDEATRKRVITRLNQNFALATGEQFIELGQVLADIAGNDIVDFFLQLAHDKAERRDVVRKALTQLSRLPDKDTNEHIIERLLRHFHDDVLYWEATSVLIEMWGIEIAGELYKRHVPLPKIRSGVGLFASANSEMFLKALALEKDGPLQEVMYEVLHNLPDTELLDNVRKEQDASALMILASELDRRVIQVPAGDFIMGYDNRRVHVDVFLIDKFPVTNLQYRRFLEENPSHPIPYIDESWAKPYNWNPQTKLYPLGKADHPVVLVTYHDAIAYAKWAGKRLPTEVEWEKAARGPDGRIYPWGNHTPSRKLCNFNAHEQSTTPVSEYSPQGDSPYGCVDMAGNVWEWTASDLNEDQKALRGGGWHNAWSNDVRAATRTGGDPRYSLSYLGFRCAVTL